MKNPDWKRVNRKNPCQICGAIDWCGYNVERTAAICMREPSQRPTKQGGFWHPLEAFVPGANTVQNKKLQSVVVHTPSEPKIATENRRHVIYNEFLDELELSVEHRVKLICRGIDYFESEIRGYKSVPDSDGIRGPLERLSRRFYIKNVPGFYSDWNGKLSFTTYGASGFLIPIRNAQAKIIALQIRRDDARTPKYLLCSSADKQSGASSGAPPHIAVPKLGHTYDRREIESCIITEGILKADVIAVHAEKLCVGLVGVSTFDENLPTMLRSSFPNLKTVSIAFDMDSYQKPQVLLQRKRLRAVLSQARLNAEVLQWNPDFKGFDDYLTRNI